MHRLMLISILLAVNANAGLIRIPKIYNALISSDENLSPSHTYPIIEPVLRTTALGVAFPPLLASPPVQKEPPRTLTQESTDKKQEPTASTESNVNTANAEKPEKDAPQKMDEKVVPQLSYHGTLYPLAFDPYLSYAYSNDFLFPTLPYYEHPVFVDLNNFKGTEKPKEREDTNLGVNFKKNPEIPDVPPPPLPVNKGDRNEKQQ